MSLGRFPVPISLCKHRVISVNKQKSSKKAELHRPRNPGQVSAAGLMSAGKATAHLLSIPCELDTLPLYLP